jgi:hypothetical protein
VAGTYACLGIPGWMTVSMIQHQPHVWPRFWYLGVAAGVVPNFWRNKTFTPGQKTAVNWGASLAGLFALILLLKGNVSFGV